MLNLESLVVESFETQPGVTAEDDGPASDIKCYLATVPLIKNTYLGETNCMEGCNAA